ncbi:RHS repeat-associated core domain-containing protein, partial [Alloalcanivorax profundimaris]|uniref:RHS repeat-associated core domain-containing protein n=1 Tax=Alloalcanivorax profundimaris TaxID=2735259 RepID=UPI001891863F
FGARDYDPQTGRWAEKDPIRFEGDGFNMYAYAKEDPVSFVDPLGTISVSYDFSRNIGFGVTVGIDNDTGKPFLSLRGQLGHGVGFAIDPSDNGPFDRDLTEGPYGAVCTLMPSDGHGSGIGSFVQTGASFAFWGLSYGAEGGRHFNDDGTVQSYSDIGPDVNANVLGLNNSPLSFSFGGTFGVEVSDW